MAKSNVKISAGATIVVEDENGAQHKYTCTGANEVTGHTPAEVLKAIQDCVRKSIKAASSSKRRK